MKILPLKGFRSAIGLRMVAQFLALALLPVAALGAVLAAQNSLTPAALHNLELVAASAALAALLLALVQSEIIVRRLESLTRSTHRIAMQDFSAAAPADGNDEVSKLANAINAMARHLDASLSAQQILAQMDDAILTKLDVGALIRSALRCIRLVTLGEVVVLGLFENDAADSLRLFVIREGERNRISSHKIELVAELKRRVPLTPTDHTEPLSPFPEDYENKLRSEVGVAHFFAMPISRGNRAWGVIVSCHKAPARFSQGQVKMLGGVANRLIAGFSGAERDQKLHSLAYVDPLTGLPNRVAMQSLLSRELTKAKGGKTTMAILFIDLDRFKQANDTHGHAFGDRLLIQASNRIRNNVREDDVVARLGGDEFTVMLPDVKTPREAASVARKLIQSLSRRFEIDGQTIYTGASVGISLYPDDGVDGPELLKKADTAMYRAKSAGRSRFAFFEEPMNAESKRRSVLDGELRNAIARAELVLHYQPQIDLRTGALCGVEALVRWQHPTKGLLFPRDFVEYAEEIGLIPEIGYWVMTEACRQHKRWREERVRVPRISVNVSNGQLPRSNFVPRVRQLLAAMEMPQGALEVEVTESMLVEGGKAAVEALNTLSALGVPIAIDDFGTGYSSFSYLKTMPARVLKLDMSFLVDARKDNDAGKIVAAIINMAHALQKEVVAEGIERVDQLKLLKSLGCERGQGFLFGKPVTAEQIARTFRADAPTTDMAAASLEEGADVETAGPPAAQAPVAAVAPHAAPELALPGTALEPDAQRSPEPQAAALAPTGAEIDAATVMACDFAPDPALETARPLEATTTQEGPGPATDVDAESLPPAGPDTGPQGWRAMEPAPQGTAAPPPSVSGPGFARTDMTLVASTEAVLDKAARDLSQLKTEQPVGPDTRPLAYPPAPEEPGATLDELSNRGEPGTVLMPLADLDVMPDTDSLAANSTAPATTPPRFAALT